MTLDELPLDGHARVTGLELRGAERRRLMDMGVVPGAEVHVDMVSPLGDPRAYVVRGGLLALRRSQARNIHVSTHVESRDA